MTGPAGLPVGAVWEIEAAGRVQVTRPDGSTSIVVSDGKVARYVLQERGTYSATLPGGKTLEAKVK